MPLADLISEASGAVDVLVEIHRELLAGEPWSLRSQLHDGGGRGALARAIDAELLTSGSIDPLSDPERRDRLIAIVDEHDLGDVGWWVLARSVDREKSFVGSRSALIREYLERQGRGIGNDQYELRPGDPLPVNVQHRYRVPAADRVDRFPGTCFVPQSADGMRVIADYRMAGAVDASVRRALHDRNLATIHPFTARDYRNQISESPKGWNFPTLPMANDPTGRRSALLEAVGSAPEATVATLHESVGTRDDVEAAADAWLDVQPNPGLLVAGTFHEEAGGRRRNVALVVGRDQAGDISSAEFLKNYPMGGLPRSTDDDPDPNLDPIKDERREDIHVCEVPEVRVLVGDVGSVGLLICRDMLHADLVALVAELGCGLVFAPSLSPEAHVFRTPGTHIDLHGAGTFVFSNALGPTLTSMVADGGRIRSVNERRPGVASYRLDSSQEPLWSAVGA